MHFERGRDFARAADFHGQAAETALRRSAHREALLHTASALELLSNQPPGTERARAELRIRLTEASALMAARGFGARAVLNAFVAARPLAEEVGDPTSRFAVLSGLWNHVILRADLEQARSFAEQLEELGRQENELELARQAHSIAAQTHLYAGEPAAATTHAELAHPNGGLVARRRLTPYFQDPVVVGRLCGAIAAWLLGRPDAARDDASEGLRLARELGYQAGTAEALWHTSVVHQCCGEVDLVGALTSELADICRDHALPNWASVGNVLRGWAMARRGDPEGVAVIKGGLAKIGSRTLTWPYHAALLVETLTRNGDRSLALETVREALDMCRSTGERWYEAELVRLRGELLVRDHPDDAAASFAEAQAIARGQQARSLELRAATSLARLLRDRGQTEHARSTLAEVYESFDEGHGTEDLIVASTLLSELSA
jgi:adenylate cyclase